MRRINPNELSDQEILNILYEEYMQIKPNGCWDFFERRKKSPSLPYLKKRFNMTYNQLLIRAGVPEKELKFVRKGEEYKDDYLNKIKELAIKLQHTPSASECIKFGYSVSIITKIFGSYNEAIKEAGLRVNGEHRYIKKSELLKIYKNLCKQLGKPATVSDIDNYCEQYNSRTFITCFGGMNKLRKIAGFEESRIGIKDKLSKQQIINTLIQEYEKKKRHLTAREIHNNGALPGYPTVLRYFETNKISDVWEEIERIISLNHFAKNNCSIQSIGKIGENNVAHHLKFLSNKCIVFNDIKLEVDGLIQQIDHLVISPNGVFHLETKYYTGEISIDRNGNWSRVNKGKYEVLEDPSGQISRHEEVFNRILGDNCKVVSIVVLSNPRCRLCRTENSNLNIVKLEKLIGFINSYGNCIKYTDEQIIIISNLIKKHIKIEYENRAV